MSKSRDIIKISLPDPLSGHVLVHDRAALLDKAEGGGNVRQFCAFLLPLVVFFALLPRSNQRGKTKQKIAYGADFINLLPILLLRMARFNFTTCVLLSAV